MENLRNQLGRMKWNVHIRERYPHGRGVLVYLVRDLRGGPLANRRLLSCDGAQVVVRYDERAKGPGGQATQQTMRLPLAQCIGRWLLHVPPAGAVCGWGLYGYTQWAALAQCQQQMGQGRDEVPPLWEAPHAGEVWGAAPADRCPVWGQPLVCTALAPRAGVPPPAAPGWEQVA